ncbi:uncharacterized protein LOC121781441 [Salvia splendens]|uniref:uncharacterized protein LOC121781441 n=1 Tax=Salvia splendens TaxID=180675 RepID=UPI001C280E9C|nr:uncharacterized protein LOC121781441 [Salvia splendens]
MPPHQCRGLGIRKFTEGNIYFWDDIWLGNEPLRGLCLDERGRPEMLVSELVTDGTWDGAKLQGLEDLCQAGVTATIAIFTWRLLSNRIPIDSKLQWRKIELASKCQCCPRRPETESLQHLFIQGDGAIRVWREFDGWFEGNSPPIGLNDTIPSRIEVWATRLQQPGRKHLIRALPYLIFRFLWAERNRSRHHGTQFKASNVIWQVITFVRNNMINGKLRPKHWRGVRLGFIIPNEAEAQRPMRLTMMIKWEPPDQPWLKLNTYGSFFEETGKAGGGGLIRDYTGRVLKAFALPLDAHSPLEAELLAMHHGLVMAAELARPIWLETEAEKAVALVRGNHWGPAHIRQAMAFLALDKRRLTLRISFIHREGNKAADLLAKTGAEMSHSRIFVEQDLPRELSDIIRQEQMGIPNARAQTEERN